MTVPSRRLVLLRCGNVAHFTAGYGPAKRPYHLFSGNHEANSFMLFDEIDLPVGRNAASRLPALNGRRRFADAICDRASASEASEKVWFVAHGKRMYDIVAHQSTKKSCIQRARISLCGAMEPIALQLKALRNRTVPKISSRDVAAALDMPPSSYAAYEDPKKFKKPLLPFQLAKRLAAVFAERGVPETETMALAGLTGELTAFTSQPTHVDDSDWVEVNGTVAAGVWKEQSDWPAAERYDVRFGPNRYRGSERFGLRMEGLSMNRTIPPGADLECIRVTFSQYEPKPGDLVIVERTNHDLTEMTCKRLDMDGDEWILRCESTEPEFQEFIRIGKPSPENHTDDEARVIAIVVGAKLDLAPTGLSERRFRYR